MFFVEKTVAKLRNFQMYVGFIFRTCKNRRPFDPYLSIIENDNKNNVLFKLRQQLLFIWFIKFAQKTKNKHSLAFEKFAIPLCWQENSFIMIITRWPISEMAGI